MIQNFDIWLLRAQLVEVPVGLAGVQTASVIQKNSVPFRLCSCWFLLSCRDTTGGIITLQLKPSPAAVVCVTQGVIMILLFDTTMFLIDPDTILSTQLLLHTVSGQSSSELSNQQSQHQPTLSLVDRRSK